eukprot:12212264-Heterocapsa_arctica.AAC.1
MAGGQPPRPVWRAIGKTPPAVRRGLPGTAASSSSTSSGAASSSSSTPAGHWQGLTHNASRGRVGGDAANSYSALTSPFTTADGRLVYRECRKLVIMELAREKRKQREETSLRDAGPPAKK